MRPCLMWATNDTDVPNPSFSHGEGVRSGAAEEFQNGIVGRMCPIDNSVRQKGVRVRTSAEDMKGKKDRFEPLTVRDMRACIGCVGARCEVEPDRVAVGGGVAEHNARSGSSVDHRNCVVIDESKFREVRWEWRGRHVICE